MPHLRHAARARRRRATGPARARLHRAPDRRLPLQGRDQARAGRRSSASPCSPCRATPATTTASRTRSSTSSPPWPSSAAAAGIAFALTALAPRAARRPAERPPPRAGLQRASRPTSSATTCDRRGLASTPPSSPPSRSASSPSSRPACCRSCPATCRRSPASRSPTSRRAAAACGCSARRCCSASPSQSCSSPSAWAPPASARPSTSTRRAAPDLRRRAHLIGAFFIGTLSSPCSTASGAPRAHAPRPTGGPLIAGVAFAVAWLPCTGPTLGAILTAACDRGNGRQGRHPARLLRARARRPVHPQRARLHDVLRASSVLPRPLPRDHGRLRASC